MAGPGGREVGRVSVRALPDTSAFARSLQRYLERVERTLRVELPVELDRSDLATANAQLAELTRDRKVNVEVDVDRSLVDRLGESLAGITGGGSFRGLSGLTGMLSRNLPMIIAAAAAVPLVVTGLLALPAIIASVALPIGAIALGIEGIKDAASGLAEPFQRLRDSVSRTFERGLTPVFDHLADIFPTLTTGFNKIAEAIVKIIDAGVSELVSDGGLAKLGGIFSNLAAALTILAPSIGPFTSALLTLLEEGTGAFARMAPYLADFITAISKMVDLLGEGGALSAAFDGFSVVLLGLVALFGIVVGNAVLMVAGIGHAARGVGKAVDLMHRLVDKGMSKIAPIFRTVGDLIKAITRGDWQKVADIVRNVASNVVTFVGTIPQKMGRALASLAATLGGVATAALSRFREHVTGGAARVVEFTQSIPRRIGGALASLPGEMGQRANAALDRFRSAISNGAARAVSLAAGVPGRIAGAVGDLSGLLYSAGRSVIQGFINGIQSMIGSVVSTLGGITSRLPDWKGPASRDRVILRGSGQMVMGGFIDGLRDGAVEVERTLRNLTGGIPAMAAPASGFITSGPTAAGVATGALLGEVRALRGDVQHQTERVDQIVGDIPRRQRDIGRSGPKRGRG